MTLSTRIQMSLLALPLLLVPVSSALAHPGHGDPVTISRSSHTFIQQTVPAYLTIQQALAAGQLGPVEKAAETIHNSMMGGASNEKVASGRKMFEAVAASADLLIGAGDLETAKEEFSDLSDALLEFFNKWPAHMDEHGMTLYTCNKTEKAWLQKNGAPQNPYTGGGAGCDQLTEGVVEE